MTSRLLCCFAIFLALNFAAVAAPPESTRLQQAPAKDHDRTNPLRGDPQAIAAGGELFRDHCEQCHKADARGDDRHPSLRTERLASASDGDLEWFLRQGDLAHGMPSWAALPKSQRWQLVAYLRSLK